MVIAIVLMFLISQARPSHQDYSHSAAFSSLRINAAECEGLAYETTSMRSFISSKMLAILLIINSLLQYQS